MREKAERKRKIAELKGTIGRYRARREEARDEGSEKFVAIYSDLISLSKKNLDSYRKQIILQEVILLIPIALLRSSFLSPPSNDHRFREINQRRCLFVLMFRSQADRTIESTGVSRPFVGQMDISSPPSCSPRSSIASVAAMACFNESSCRFSAPSTRRSFSSFSSGTSRGNRHGYGHGQRLRFQRTLRSEN